MSFLLDTDVLSETQKRNPDRRVLDWLADTRSDDLHISVLSVGEVRRGATNLQESGDLKRSLALERWLAEVIGTYRDRIVPISLTVANT